MNNNIKNLMEELIISIKSTNRYQEYLKYYKILNEDIEAQLLLKNYRLASKPLQQAAVSELEPKEDDLLKFNTISSLTFSNDIASDYINAETSMKSLLAEIIQQLSESLKIRF